MTRPWNPFVFSATGDAAVVRTPCRLVVNGPQMTPRQAAWLQAAFFSFQSSARLSAVRNLQQHGRMPDGTAYVFSITNGIDSATVYTASGKSQLVLALGGVLRDDGDAFEGGVWVGRKYFKENLTTTYVVSPKIDWDSGFGVATAFTNATLSGPAAKLAQFGRGAAGAYRDYLIRKGLGNPRRLLGDGVFIATHEGKKAAFCHMRDNAGVRALPMTILAPSEFPGLRLPKDIRDLFGGLPLPPLATDWDTAPILLSRAQLDSAAGFPSAWQRRVGLDLRFPRCASTGLGQTADFVEIFREEVEGGLLDQHSVQLRVTFGLNLLGNVNAVVQRMEAGRYSFALRNIAPFAAASSPAPGVYKGPAGVTHVGGRLVTFYRESEVIQGRNASGTHSLVRTQAYSWEGAATGRTIFDTMPLAGVSTHNTLDAIYQDASTGTERVDSGPDAYAVFERRTASFSWTETSRYSTAPFSELGPLLTFEREGCYATAHGSSNASMSTEKAVSSHDFGTYRGNILYSYANGEITHHSDPGPPVLRTAKQDYERQEGNSEPGPPVDEGAPGDFVFLQQLAQIYGLTVTKEGTPFRVVSDRLMVHARGAVVPLDLFDFAARCAEQPDQFRENWGRTMVQGTRGLLYEIPQNPLGVVPTLERWVLDVSQLGGEQMVLRVVEMADRVAALRMAGMVRGTLVNTTEDINYPWRVPVWFIGELQP
ncbi:hypothetical protein [Delftia acidovorans]|uniref:hypothetical protein n=1 Tax=Delftia acidovorans TaxID=80866 RepID=UPI000BD25B39|nr:hypothetical protein [Delftia acidovorans]SOE35302.1 hypothetical protein SAMN05216519_1282 [Delftia acidovorans]